MQQSERIEERMTPAVAGATLATAPVARPESSPRAEAIVERMARQGAGGSLAEAVHDTRNLVTALALYCDLLEEPGVLTPACRHYAGELRLVVQACRGLVEQLAALDVVRSGRQFGRAPAPPQSVLPAQAARRERAHRWESLPPEPVADLAAELAANRNLLAALAGPGIVVTVESRGGARPCRLNGEELTRILVNLVKNAAEAMPMGGRIRIGLEEKQEEKQDAAPVQPTLLLTVEDSGPGLPTSILERVFEPGYTTRPASSGVVHRGLGLSIARSIVWAAGGRISAANRPQGGARFEIELPVAVR